MNLFSFNRLDYGRMEQQSNREAIPDLCRSGCGFFGNPSTDGHCSVCFDKILEKKQQAPSLVVPTATSTTLTSSTCPTTTNAAGDFSTLTVAADYQNYSQADIHVANTTEEKTKKKNRCATCNKKVGLVGCKCRCGGLYCAIHKYSDRHGCTFNYRELGAEEIRRNNPLIMGTKIRKI